MTLMLAGAMVAFPLRSIAPVLETPYTEELEDPQIQSLEDLYQIRDRLRAELESPAATPTLTGIGIFSAPTTLLQELQAVEIRIQVEETAEKNWDRARQLADEASDLETRSDDSPETIKNIYSLWQEAVNALKQVPQDTFLTTEATTRLEEYEKNLSAASYNYDTSRSGFLKAIAERTELPPEDVFITVCNLAGECRRWQGNKTPASPASLIKMPVAIALMEKVATDNINLDTKITVSRGNYTEDASDIWVGSEYTLRKLLERMINQSSNIATNQLIDYLGRDYINQVMRDRGFPVTFVDYKLVGESTFPANAGSRPNRFNTDEMTEMMRQIYAQEHPGDDVLIEILASQYDTVLGYDGLRSTRAIWMGEKTGQNSKMLGTTLAFTVNGEYYVATVALNYTANERALRRCINDIAKHIEQQGHL
ncbi:serine hydrolase [Oscillatoria sp. FACHB-1407]|uniref:serine hydrolase n=1 Tax=Oscillatoria sp. FACHB-1407 TaxID=2692847 RepID=UPI0016883DEB|nr:serine hydrolase [Oscillatoria sp. FACHB-1407]MBD2461718.1 serine hydrolase [Oscillatoria sp. FACHB-1407]